MRRHRKMRSGELAHRNAYLYGCIGVLSAGGACLARTEAERRQPVSEMKRSGIELALLEKTGLL